MSFWRPVSAGTSVISCSASAASEGETPTTDRSGCAWTRCEYQITNAIASETRTNHIAIRRPIPSPIVIPAASEATPVENGLTVEAITPLPAPRKMIAAAVMRSYPRARASGTSSTKKPSVSSHIPYEVPPRAKTHIRIAISTAPLARKRSASRPIPVWIASDFIVTVMNAPTARTKKKIAAEPYRKPSSHGPTNPLPLSTP